MNIGATIKDIRKEKGIKQAELAESCSITQSYLSNIESNKKEPALSTLKDISEQLNLPLPILFFLSMDEDDVEPKKKDLFNSLGKIMKTTLKETFVKNDTI